MRVDRLLESSFTDMEFSDGRERDLVRSLRSSANYIPDLSLVAQLDEKIVGYILMTRIKIRFSEGWQPSLALAPMAVEPSLQRRGLGSELIARAHQKAREIGYPSAVVVGHRDYYPRFGYQPLRNFNIRVPFEVPADNCFIIHLREECRLHTDGHVEYDEAFYV